jgi:hypothetical protein
MLKKPIINDSFCPLVKYETRTMPDTLFYPDPFHFNNLTQLNATSVTPQCQPSAIFGRLCHVGLTNGISFTTGPSNLASGEFWHRFALALHAKSTPVAASLWRKTPGFRLAVWPANRRGKVN